MKFYIFLVILIFLCTSYDCFEPQEESNGAEFYVLNPNIKTFNENARGGYRPYYIDNSSICQIIFYTAMRVIKNCSNLNLATVNLQFLYENTLSITELHLSSNGFESTVPYMQINTYPTVRILDLGNNRLSEFTNDLQYIDCNTTCIKNISLHSNLFSKFPILSPTCSNNIRHLNLSFNKNLRNIDQDYDVYRQMPNLENLDLAYCNIEYLNLNNISIFNKMPSLIYLNMTGNRIKNIYPNPFLNLIYLRYLSFDPSLLECRNSLLWLKYFLIKNPQIQGISPDGILSNRPYEPSCFNILTNQSQNIIISPDSSFYTDIYLTSSIKTKNINVMFGKTIDLDCEQYSIPGSDFWWTFNNRVLTRTASADSPYEFIENFDALNTKFKFNKTSILRIRNINEKLSGTYSCKAFYNNVSMNHFNRNISFIEFNVNVEPNPNISTSSLSAGQIAGIVIGSIIGFLLLCLLLFLLAWCCCYKRGLCCCCPCFAKKTEKSETFTKNSLGYSSTTNSKKYLTSGSYEGKFDMEDNASGFHDLSSAKPNYVINTISSRSGHGQKHFGLNSQSGFEKNEISNNTIMIDEYPLTSLSTGNVYNVQTNNQFSNEYQLGLNQNNLNQNNFYKSSVNAGYLNDDIGLDIRREAPIKRYVETTEYSTNHFISENDYDGRNEFHDEKMMNKVIIDNDDEYSRQFFRPDDYQANQQISAYNKKYDSDV